MKWIILLLEVEFIINWLDIIIIIIIAYSAIKGFLTGLVLSLSNLLAFVGGLFVAIKYKGVLTDYLIVVWHLDKKIAPIIESKIAIEQAEQLTLTLPQMLKNIENIAITNGNAMGKMISIEVAQQAINIFSFLFLLIITNIIIKTVGYLFHSILDWGFFAPINRIGGVFFGALRGLLLVIIIVALLTPLPLAKEIEQSYIGEKVYNNLIKLDLSHINEWQFNNRS